MQSLLYCQASNKNISYTDFVRSQNAQGFQFQFSSVTQLCLTLCDPMNCSTPGLLVHHQLPESTKLMSIELVMPSSQLILCRPLLLLPLIPPSIRVFSNQSALRMRWPKYWIHIDVWQKSSQYDIILQLK